MPIMSPAADHEKTAHGNDIAFAPELEAVEALKAVKAGHADDVDIAAQILANNIDIAGSESWSLAEDKSLMRKVDWRLIPIVSTPSNHPGYILTTTSSSSVPLFQVSTSQPSRQLPSTT